MAIIEFILDENNQQQVLTVINTLEEKANTDRRFKELYALVIRGLKFLKKYGISQGAKELFAELEKEDETPYTIRLIKELKYHPPLYEFRINWKGAGAFRAILFEYSIDNEQLLVFTRAMVKQQTNSADFEQMIIESKKLLYEFYQAPEKFIKGDGVND